MDAHFHATFLLLRQLNKKKKSRIDLFTGKNEEGLSETGVSSGAMHKQEEHEGRISQGYRGDHGISYEAEAASGDQEGEEEDETESEEIERFLLA